MADHVLGAEDILHARVRTVGITEERFRVDKQSVYRIYDVGGSRSQRHRWASYFDDAQAIIFLAPISAFDQALVEDGAVNRVVDSLALFEQVVGNRLLRDVSLVLFLNKVDVLERKLRQGVQVAHHFPEYSGDNSFEDVWRWFRGRFRALVASSRSVAPKRPIYVHTTVATVSCVPCRAVPFRCAVRLTDPPAPPTPPVDASDPRDPAECQRHYFTRVSCRTAPCRAVPCRAGA